MAARRNVVDMVVAKLPPPGKMKPGAAAKADDADNIGEDSAFEDFVAALGVKPKDAAEAKAALADYVSMCVAKRLEGEYGDE